MEKDKQQDAEGLQQTEQAFQETETNEVLQHSDEGETKEKDRWLKKMLSVIVFRKFALVLTRF